MISLIVGYHTGKKKIEGSMKVTTFKNQRGFKVVFYGLVEEIDGKKFKICLYCPAERGYEVSVVQVRKEERCQGHVKDAGSVV